MKELVVVPKKANADIDIAPPEDLADVVVVDAPCSGTGAAAQRACSPLGFGDFGQSRTQRELIDEAAHFVQQGGLLAYATAFVVLRRNDHEAPARVMDRTRPTGPLASS